MNTAAKTIPQNTDRTFTDHSALAFGDWHGNDLFAVQALHRAHTLVDDTVPFIHVGDFGFTSRLSFSDYIRPSHLLETIFDKHLPLQQRHDFVANLPPYAIKGYLAEVDTYLRSIDRILHVVLGNHEDYWSVGDTLGFGGFIEPAKSDKGAADLLTWGTDPFKFAAEGEEVWTDDQGFLCSPLFTNIRIVPRTHIWTWNGTRFGSLGGACSIDKGFRTTGVSWWPEEVPTKEQVRSLKNESVDVLVCHDGPLPATELLYGHGQRLPKDIQDYAEVSGAAVEEARFLTQPHVLVHGHHHKKYSATVGDTKVVGVSADVNGSVEDNIFLIPSTI